jgi:hypothetical protein
MDKTEGAIVGGVRALGAVATLSARFMARRNVGCLGRPASEATIAA